MEKPMIWNGLDVDFWGPTQTRNPPKDRTAMKIAWYNGFDTLRIDADMVERIPLDIRYQSFTKRLDKALGRVV